MRAFSQLLECRTQPCYECGSLLKRGFAGTPDILDKIDAAHQLHREETIVAVDEKLIKLDEIRMSHVGKAAEFALQTVRVGRARPK